MPLSSFVDGLLAGFGIAIPVGAVAILIVNAAIQYGFAVGWAAGAGAATADLLYASLASMAGVALSAWLRPLAGPLQILGGVVLVGLAGSGLRRARSLPAPENVQREARAPLGIFLQFVGITMVNPMTIVYFTALILGEGRVHDGHTLIDGLVFILGVGIASFSWQTGLAAVGGLARNRLTPRFHLLATVMGNLLVMLLGARILIFALVP